MEDLLNTEVWNGKSVADYLTLDMIVSVVGSLASAIVILVIALVVSGWASRRIRTIGETHAKLDDTLFNFLSNIARYVIMAFAILFVLNTFGIQTTSMVAAIGAAGLAIGLALQGTLSNVAAGVMLILFRPIKVGDFVEINDKSGTVKDVTLNYVEMASLSNTQVIVPNSEVWGNTIVNYSVYPTRRAEWTFGVGYGVNLAKAEEVILSTIMADDRAHADPEPFIQVTNLGGSSVDFLVRVWCDRTEYFAFKADMTRKVKEALDEADINIPFPTRTIIAESS
ncbi:mechanosensitive ion channel family protein [Litoreibacter albidus]|uniref:Small-conductance mechanosensitive channel n=1 Tax=Litoreibacter albidus TaxID=670155 RepID=A0A1H2VUY3_9RHOB|nr:mechanosensitive ion channel family protein [Litoreibacter albidus]SDW72041.1 small conductance mechanosensitive channel [Litoreibacter albidus]